MSTSPLARALGALLAIVVGAGCFGTYSYADGYWRYRGFGPPVSTQPPERQGRIMTIELTSRAIGGRTVPVYVYLPAAYRQEPTRRFPTVYLLQGMPGTAKTAYIDAFHVGPVLDDRIASGQLRPMIAVIPTGSLDATSLATEWANGRRADEQWDTFLTRDVVHAIDRDFRTIARPGARGIGGYSAGGNEAVNAAIWHSGTFRVIESWSGDFAQTARLVEHDRRIVRHFSAYLQMPAAAARLRRLGTRFFIYVGVTDQHIDRNLAVVDALRRAGARPTFRVLPGGHSWRIWHEQLPAALEFFSTNLATS